MKAALVETLEGPDAVRVRDVPEPVAGPDTVLVDVHAAGVAYPALLQTRGEYQVRPDLPFTPGSEIAGVVRTAPPGSGLETGQRVLAFCRRGAFAEVAVANREHVFPLPDTLTFEQGAALVLNHFTAYFCLIQKGRLHAGEAVLVHGAAGGVGIATVQVAKAFGAGRVVAVVSTEAKGAVAIDAGADEYVRADGFREAVLANGAVDVVIDPVGGDRFLDSLRCLRPAGRAVVVGFASGVIPEVKINRLLLNNTEVVGASWGPWILDEPSRMAAQWRALEPHVSAGRLTPLIDAVMPLDHVADALAVLDERRAVGKVVLSTAKG